MNNENQARISRAITSSIKRLPFALDAYFILCQILIGSAIFTANKFSRSYIEGNSISPSDDYRASSYLFGASAVIAIHILLIADYMASPTRF
jgi:hypothetical protein